ncbi:MULTISPECIES: WecB/TagA/CpsF family glycosyltransferase [unclassified Proteiniphilum]|jgi:N-acetylglucosaminyldiphosphoundecaprenol N-acetyl-beta-D-mannosaminyltransferase|uniref:WecB/TagA/CpsF family glycosyltransferase n=1 Tax=unclassified Proteiniphilum TaxID=2622718 RepID=UPI00257C6F1A|nr:MULTISPECIES: WecB/TagA/CpsF family glycosyltransferase [unclassified Proteiniphilum]
MLQTFELYNGALHEINSSKQLITTLNAHSFNTLKSDPEFLKALQASDKLLPDGISMVWAMRLLKGVRIKKIAGADLFKYEMQRVYQQRGKCFFLGSSDETLNLIKERAKREFPGLHVYGYSPPFKPFFDEEDTLAMISAVNEVEPDVLFVGMTAPKQEKWSFEHFHRLKAGHICCIGAVFDFYAGTVRRAPGWMISVGLEWFYRLIREPRRMWRRYLIGNILFVLAILKEKFLQNYKVSQTVSVRPDAIKGEQA